jgi:hypothetical protein
VQCRASLGQTFVLFTAFVSSSFCRWFDKNWGGIIPGLDFGDGVNYDRVDNVVWGQEIFRTVTNTYNRIHGLRSPGMPTMGLSMYSSSHPAEHRFPAWWTGDVVYTGELWIPPLPISSSLRYPQLSSIMLRRW